MLELRVLESLEHVLCCNGVACMLCCVCHDRLGRGSSTLPHQHPQHVRCRYAWLRMTIGDTDKTSAAWIQLHTSVETRSGMLPGQASATQTVINSS